MQTDAPSFIEMREVSYTYPGWPTVVDRVSWSIRGGEFHSFVGRSGCGKTTLLKLAAGLLQPQHGRILMEGRDVARPDPSMSFVFQSPTLLEWLSVLDNVLLPISLQRSATAADHDAAANLLAQMGLSGYAGQSPKQLSGGQQSRVAIARALITAPRVLLMDEPFAALDAITREELQVELLRLCRTHSTAVLFVTHDINEAVYLSDRVGVMQAGRIRHDLPIDLPNLPNERATALRYSPAFNHICAQLRDAMNQADDGNAVNAVIS